MSYRRKYLTENEIEEMLEECIPSDGESVFEDSDDTDADPDYKDPPNATTTFHYSSSDSEDDVPLQRKVGSHKKTVQTVINNDTSDTNGNIGLDRAAASTTAILSNNGVPQMPNNSVPELINWGKTERPSDPHMFTSEHGPTSLVKDLDDINPQNLFKVFISDEIIDNIVFQTNLYAEQIFQKTGKVYKPTSRSEVNTFIGMNILMGIKCMPSYRDYWSSSPDLHDSYIARLMPVNRFGWLLSHLHLNDNNLAPKRGDLKFDKLYKLRPFLTQLSEKFQISFQPCESMAVDESMIKFKGRSSLKQYLPKKPIKRGFKVWILADKSGYVHKFDIYTGKKDGSVEKQLGERVVKGLVQDIENKNHKIYFDNFFTSVGLLHHLAEKNIYACGTVNPSRKNLPTLKDDKLLKRGEYDWSTSDTGLTAVKWKDKRSVHLLSNYHNPEDVTEVSRKEKDGTITKIPCPKVLHDYNQNMNSVDKFDQMKGVYEIDRKSKKWWHRIFWYFIDASIVNAFILYKECGSPPKSLKDFRRDISRSLVSPALVLSRNTVPQKRKSDSPVQIKKKKPHVPRTVRLESSAHQPQRGTRRRCAKCSTKAKQVRTDWLCSVCKVPLCLGKNKTCFQEYHNN